MTNWAGNQRIGVVIIGAMAIVIAVLVVLLMNPDEVNENGNGNGADVDFPSTLESGTPVAGQVDAVNASDCWSEDDRIAVDEDADNEGLYPQWESPPEMVIDEDASYRAIVTTNKGDMTFDLNSEAAPATVNAFVCLVVNGYYEITPFHRVMAGFMVQGGDPTGTGGGGPGFQTEDELPGDDLNYTRGTLAMANAGPDTQGSQFFIVHEDSTDALQKLYTIFGRLVEGEDVLDDIADSAVVPNQGGEPSRPVEFLVVEEIAIEIVP
ncbi:MAG: peptidylprolyl isomerase [Chloroflexota bacterium]|nr:peptidylprolyl isomerase [Chloroflexota bacterium]